MRRNCSGLRLAFAVIAVTVFLYPACLQAGVIYIDSATFIADLQPGYYLETFSSLTGTLPNPINFSSGGFSYSAFAPNGFYPTMTAGDRVLSTSMSTDAITMTFTSGNVTAVGGYFYASDINGNVTTGTVTLNLSDGTSVTLTNPTAATFRGFMTAGVPITSLVIALDSPSGTEWPTVDDFYVGQSAAVPEPSSAILMAAGILALAGLRARRSGC